MEEVKRYDLTAPEKGMPMLYPSDKGVCVLYTDYAAQVDSSGNYYVDENDTTNPCVMIVGANKSDIDAATVRARVLCVFLADALAQQT
jgi:hypothetical protein